MKEYRNNDITLVINDNEKVTLYNVNNAFGFNIDINYRSFIQSLKDIIQQVENDPPQQQWSEEDEINIARILIKLRKNNKGNDSDSDLQEMAEEMYKMQINRQLKDKVDVKEVNSQAISQEPNQDVEAQLKPYNQDNQFLSGKMGKKIVNGKEFEVPIEFTDEYLADAKNKEKLLLMKKEIEPQKAQQQVDKNGNPITFNQFKRVM